MTEKTGKKHTLINYFAKAVAGVVAAGSLVGAAAFGTHSGAEYKRKMQEAAPLAGDTQIALTYAEVFCKSGAKKREEYGVPRFGANINAGKKVLIKVDGADRVLVCPNP